MSEKSFPLNITAPTGIQDRTSALWLRLVQTDDNRRVCIAIFLLSVGVMLLWRQFTQLEKGDAAIWDYVAQGILRGEVPYRDVIEIKGPGSAYLSASAMWLGKFAGVRDVLAVRFMQIALAGLLSVVTYLVAEVYLRRRLAALIAFLLPLTSGHFVSWTEGGTQPKLTMILFGMLTLLLIARDRPFWAGVCSMLSCLCWQPGLLFTGIAILIFSRYLSAWRDWRALNVLAGAMLPILVVVVYFRWEGALSDLWVWTVAYNFEVYAPDGIRSPAETLAHMWTVLFRVLYLDMIWFALGLAGLAVFSGRQLSAKVRLRQALKSPDLFKDGILIAPVGYIAFCLINLQSGPDLMPLFPLLAIFAGWLITETSRRFSSSGMVASRPALLRVVGGLPALALGFVCALALIRAATYRMEDWTLWRQDTQLKMMSGLIGPDDKIYVHGAVEILLSLNRPNLNPYIMWDHGKARYIAEKKYGGSSEAMIGAIEAERPKLVVVSRLKHVPEGALLERLLEQHYEALPITGYDAYLRKQ